MAIAYDAGSGVNSGASSGHVHNHTTGSGSDRMLVAHIHVGHATVTVTAVTYNSVVVTLAAGPYTEVRHTGKMYTYMLPAPASGTNTLAVSLSGSAGVAIKVNTFTGCSQVTTPDATATNDSTGSSSHSTTATTVADNCWLVGQTKDDAGNGTAGANTTAGGSGGAGGGDRSWYTSTAQTPAGSKTMNYSAVGSGNWDSQIISIAPTAAAPTIRLLSLTGVGL